MSVRADRKKCLSCAGCVAVCPVNALTLNGQRIEADDPTCTNCNACVLFCPVGCLKIVETPNDSSAAKAALIRLKADGKV